MRLVLRFGHGKPGRSAARLSGTGAAALAGGAVAEKGSPSVRSGATSRGPSAVGQSPLGPATGGSWAVRFEESGARGRKPRLSAEDLKKIERGLKHGPEALGYETGLWTAWRGARLIWGGCGGRSTASPGWRRPAEVGSS